MHEVSGAYAVAVSVSSDGDDLEIRVGKFRASGEGQRSAVDRVDSIGVVVFCGGNNRLSVPEARFLLHGVSAGFQNERLEEKQLEERLKGLQNNVENIAKVIAANTNKSVQDIRDAILERTILSPEEAKGWGLVNEIRTELFEKDSEVISIQFQQTQQNQALTE